MSGAVLVPGRWRARARRWLPFLGVLAYCGALLRHALPPDAILTRRDAFTLYLPLKQFLSEELRAGRVPTWYPYDGLGLSYLGSSVAGLFHPGNVLYLIFSPAQGLKWQTLLCYPFAAWGMSRLARRLGARRSGAFLAALAFAGAGYLLSASDNLPYLLTAAALPWTLLAAEGLSRRPGLAGALWLALALALALCGGDVQGAFLQGLAASAVVLTGRRSGRGGGARRFGKPPRRRARAGWLAAAWCLLVLLTLPLLLPVWATFRDSARARGFAPGESLVWPLHPWRILELALGPHLPSSWLINADRLVDLLGGSKGTNWAFSELIGIVVMALALAALARPLPRRLRVHAVIGAVALALSLGSYLGLYPALLRFAPPWRSFRYPEKIMPFAIAALSLLAAWGARAVARADARLRWIVASGLVLLPCWALVTAPHPLASWIATRVNPIDAPDPASLGEIVGTLRYHAGAGFVALAALLALAVKGGRWTVWAAAAIHAAQVLLLSSWIIGAGPRAWAERGSPFRPPAQAALAEGAGRLCWSVRAYEFAQPPDLDAEHLVLVANIRTLAPVSGRWHIGNTYAYMPGHSGFFAAACPEPVPCGTPCSRVAAAGLGLVQEADLPALLRNHLVARTATATRPAAERSISELSRAAIPASPAIAADIVPGPGSRTPPLQEAPMEEARIEPLMRDENPRVVLFRDRAARPFASLVGARYVPESRARDAVFDPARDVRSEAILVGAGQDIPAPGGTIAAARPRPDRIEADVQLPRPGLAVFAEACERGWSAHIDGAATRIEKADGFLCAVMVPAGTHRIALTYRPWGWPVAFLGPGLFGAVAIFAAAQRQAKLVKVLSSR